jgi:hypothetical protein
MSDAIRVEVAGDAPAVERAAAAAFLLGSLLADMNLLPSLHRTQLRNVAAHLVDALDQYEQQIAPAP